MFKVYIGTSGWVYADWRTRFYPKTIAGQKHLSWYAAKLDTVEVNYSFYHLPKISTYTKWGSSVPGSFVFSIKASRFITHIKRLSEAKEPLKNFINNAGRLKDNLGPILFQLPPSFRVDNNRLAAFLKLKKKAHRWAFEFRHESWFTDKTLSILDDFNIACVIADSAKYPLHKAITADFTYVRLHGPKAMFRSKYTKKEISTWARDIKKWMAKGDVYVYFNNDAQAAAPANALMLKKLVTSKK